MLTQQAAFTLGRDWIDAWNEKQLTAYCSLYDEDAEEISTLANQLIEVSKGRVKGKEALRNYWELIRQLHPDYGYELLDIKVYDKEIVLHFKMRALNTKAVAKLTLNKKNKIEKTVISHV